ncbi:MAG: HIRAN domain-containing protein [Streptococcus sp.]|nr:HIRAN domain-containing protein [Streptococcus sp.]
MWFLLFVALCMTIFFVGVNLNSRRDTHSAENSATGDSVLGENLQKENLETEEKHAEKEFVWHRVTKVKGMYFRDGVGEVFSLLQGDNLSFMGMDSKEIRAYLKDEREIFDYGRIYEFEPVSTSNVQLVPEPDNPYDENALKVVVEGIFIGYVSKGYAKQLQKYVNNESFSVDCLATFSGGKHKSLSWEYTRVQNGEKALTCKLEIKVKKMSKKNQS